MEGPSILSEHRTVVLPDYQGTGIGSVMSDAVAHELELLGYAFTSLTIHPFFGSYRDKSPFWRPCPTNHGKDKQGRPCYSHFWVGDTGPDGSRIAAITALLQRRLSRISTARNNSAEADI